MSWFKHHNPTPLQFFVSGGISFPIMFLFVFSGNKKLGFDINVMPTWLIITVMISIYFITYFAVHYLPPKVAMIAGFFGWLTIPVVLLFSI
jgi:hypothetical protein